TTYTAVFTPTSGVDTQTATIQVLASGSGTSSWTDTLGNPGLASNTFSITEDTKGPTVRSEERRVGKEGKTESMTFTYSEAVTGGDSAHTSGISGTMRTVSQSNGTTYTAVFTPTSGVDTQTATIQVVASGTGTSSWTDTLGNPGLASNTFSITEDTKGPTVTVAGSPTLKAGQTGRASCR